jgi:hypothetical protein
MRKTAFVLSVLLATATANIAKADGEIHARHHHYHHVVAVASACDPYDVKWHVLGSVVTMVVASALMPWALHDLDDSVEREKHCHY